MGVAYINVLLSGSMSSSAATAKAGQDLFLASYEIGGSKPSSRGDVDEEAGVADGDDCHLDDASVLAPGAASAAAAVGRSLFTSAFRWLGPAGKEDTEEEDSVRKDDSFFLLADNLEKGFARETTSDVMAPLPRSRSRKLWQFMVVRSEDRLQHRLFTRDGDFLMFAQVSIELRSIGFFLYDPGNDEAQRFQAGRPAFVLAFDEGKLKWRLVKEKCEHCEFVPTQLSCALRGKQQVAFVKHSRSNVGDGTSNEMETHIPGIFSDSGRVIWCPSLGRGDLNVSSKRNKDERLRLVTRKPVWSDQFQCLVLDFQGRSVAPSSKNFQLVLPHKPDHILMQFAKLGSNNFGLDVKFPLSLVQAFGIAMTTIFWK
mmetsp:Transcript_2561/g.5917  ORF Transcript_2561/g.5917 Transcript_2561/m.5917 type:complete len:370 (+) Transcript_2561:42-1151(+)